MLKIEEQFLEFSRLKNKDLNLKRIDQLEGEIEAFKSLFSEL